MIVINIKPEEVRKSKILRDVLDANKTYDKFKCDTNYIGVLGELVLHRYLKENNVEHTWVEFNKPNKGFNEPDFIIDGKTIDLKTTYSDCMWFQKPKHQVYIYAQITSDNKFLLLSGFISKEDLNECIISNKTTTVTRGNRSDYVINPVFMKSIKLEERHNKWQLNI